jgi:hypothetical protein
MKKVLFLLMLLAFLGCEKQELKPAKSLVNVEIYAFNTVPTYIGMNTIISGEKVKIEDNSTIYFDTPRGQIVYRTSFYLDENQTFSIKEKNNKSTDYILRLDVYTKEGRRTFNYIDNQTLNFQLSDNWYNDILLK